MYHDKKRKDKKRIISQAIALAVLAICFIFAGYRLSKTLQTDISMQATQSVKQAILNAAVQCFAVEGAYPQNLAQLENDYGVRINHQKFTVNYEAFASNILPDVRVWQK